MDWLITTTLASAISTVLYYIKTPPDRYKLGLLSTFYWGTTIMVFVDHLMGSILEKTNFIEIKMSSEAWTVGIAMVVTVFAIWSVILIITDPKNKT